MFTEDQEPVAELKVSEPALNSHTAAASMLPSSSVIYISSHIIENADFLLAQHLDWSGFF